MEKKKSKALKSAPSPSSNWLALQKKLEPSIKKSRKDGPPFKRRKIHHAESSNIAGPSSLPADSEEAVSFTRGPRAIESTNEELDADHETNESRNGESISMLRRMIFGKLEYLSHQEAPGKYLALDCEMVGIGLNGGEESSLARVSLVNYHGAVQMDEFVRQRERVVDYRTQWSGIRATDMVKAKPFEEVQKKVADLLKDRILVGHAVHNDLKVLLLSHPGPTIRDTQQLAAKHKVTKSNRPALRNLVKQELNITIQGGEHSSVTDARATMAVFRIHRKQWEKGLRPPPVIADTLGLPKKRKEREDGETDDESLNIKTKNVAKDLPGGGRKGISSGLSTIVKRTNVKVSRQHRQKDPDPADGQWWTSLGGTLKGSLKLRS
ncbi:ribonuclease H-like domain-containing protein [Hygrophoropsis aurantiaca]|uniref:Ribonuclease H-like domain-containing protein n=1 Tax=Hygrophoropsis aurantiaca TaxID=72124 RepID=A0ACB8AHJ0_9AGAM|nr:ribonuclease H-like domain-containing protein [Hygrophoropsis aurantiaca]